MIGIRKKIEGEVVGKLVVLRQWDFLELEKLSLRLSFSPFNDDVQSIIQRH